MDQKATEKKPFTVMVKPVGSGCNMRCRYCYYLGKEQRLDEEYMACRKGGLGNNDGADERGGAVHLHPRIMSTGLLERLIRQTMESAAGSVVSFIWHGGEPTLAGLEFYEQAVKLEKKYLPRGFQVWNNLQTNGLLIDDRWCCFLKDNHFDVGLSIDGTQEVHDLNRPDAGGKGTWERVCQAAGRLLSAGILPDLLCTVNSASLKDPLAVYRVLRDLNTGWIQFIPIVVRNADGTFSDESVTPEGYGDFLCRIFDEWIHNDLGQTDVQLFAEMAGIIAGRETSLCWMAPTCGRVLIAEADGNVYSCDHFVDLSHRLGNLKTKNIEDLADSGFQTAFGNSKHDRLTFECRKCQWLSYCGGGCPKDRFGLSADGEPGQYYLCAGLKSFFAHAERPLKRAVNLSRRGLTPEQIMEKI